MNSPYTYEIQTTSHLCECEWTENTLKFIRWRQALKHLSNCFPELSKKTLTITKSIFMATLTPMVSYKLHWICISGGYVKLHKKSSTEVVVSLIEFPNFRSHPDFLKNVIQFFTQCCPQKCKHSSLVTALHWYCN